MGRNKTHLVVISADHTKDQREKVVDTLSVNKEAIRWKLTDLKGIIPALYTHKPVAQPQRMLNSNTFGVIKNEVIKLLDVEMIYPISDSALVSLTHVVPKKGGITVTENDKKELIPTRKVTSWRVCIDYWRLNDATPKNHLPLPFVDQMVERVNNYGVYCFIDGMSDYFQIPVALEDQEKTTFTCPFGRFAY